MFPLMRWSPAREMAAFQREMEDLFGRVFGRGERWASMPLLAGYGFPSIDCAREGDNVKVNVELPGVDPKDVDITVTGNLLTIKGQRKTEKKVEEKDYFLREIGYGAFERSITLPVDVSTEDVKAVYKNGVLEITMPAEKAITGKKIEITTEGEHKKLKAA